MSNANNPMSVPSDNPVPAGEGADAGEGPVAQEQEQDPNQDQDQSRQRTTRLADGADDDDVSIANPEDYLVQRSGDGPWYESIEPVPQQIPGTEDYIMVRPLPPGPYNKWEDVLEGADEETAAQVEIMNKAIAEPEVFAEADAELLENGLRGGVLAGILKAIRNASGYEVIQGNRKQELEENVALMESMDENQIERFAALARNESKES